MWLRLGLYKVDPSQQAVVTTFGAYSRSEGPGLHYHAPFPIEQVEKVSTTTLKQTDIGGETASEAAPA